MKIRDLTTFVVGNPPPGFGGRYFVFVKLTADNGIEGVGEVYAATFHPRTVVAMVEDVFAAHVEKVVGRSLDATVANRQGAHFLLEGAKFILHPHPELLKPPSQIGQSIVVRDSAKLPNQSGTCLS